MCGIAGVFSPAGAIVPEDAAAVVRMSDAQIHRGPDDCGYFSDSHIALGHRRLSIIDLSAAGRQPLCNEDSSVWVICNGEIYNYRELTAELRALRHTFRSASDCEVLVHGFEQWGIDGMLRRVRGMFAFALYDARQRTCWLVRDRLGIKPLYVAARNDGSCVFASEVKALVASGMVGDAVNPDAVSGFLLFGSVPHPHAWRKNVKCIEPGSYVAISPEGSRTAVYWSAEGSHEEAHSNAAEVLTSAVNQHLISDAPLGIFLSSGVDATGLLALSHRAGVRARTLTVIFDEAEFNEETNAIAHRFGAEHTEVRITVRDFLDEIPHVLSVMDQPASDGLNTYFVSRAAHRAGLKTVLSGLGGDEVYRGYRHYRWLASRRNSLNAFAALPSWIRRPLANAAASLGGAVGRESWGRLRELADATPASMYLALRGFFAPDVVRRLTGRRELPSFDEGESASHGFSDGSTFQRGEISRYLHDQLLRDSDVFGMANSLEIRVPYLDHEVVEQALAMPGERHIRDGVNKPALVDAIGDPAVLAAARRPKSGFVFPMDKWMRSHSGELRERAMKADLDRKEIARLWTAFEQGRMNAVRAWSLVVLGHFATSGGSN